MTLPACCRVGSFSCRRATGSRRARRILIYLGGDEGAELDYIINFDRERQKCTSLTCLSVGSSSIASCAIQHCAVHQPAALCIAIGDNCLDYPKRCVCIGSTTLHSCLSRGRITMPGGRPPCSSGPTLRSSTSTRVRTDKQKADSNFT